jgi:cytochrome c oxidase assembly factor CtaG
VCLLPPAGTLALRYVVAESVQFTVFAMVAPALIVLGAPWRVLRLSRAGAAPASPGPATGVAPGLLDRVAQTRQEQRSFLRAAVFLLAFMAVTLVWRLPPVMDALVRQPGLIAAELVTLLAAGLGVWLELLASPPLAPRLPRPHRAAIAALAMWFTWGVAYVIGFHNGTVFTAYGSVPGRAISLIADQELAVAIVWAVAGFCFVPVVIVCMMGWLKDNDTDEELQRIVRDGNQRAVVKGWGSQVKGWGRPPQGGSGG